VSYLSTSKIRRTSKNQVDMMFTYAKPGELPQFYTIYDIEGEGKGTYETVSDFVADNPEATLDDIREMASHDHADEIRERLGISLNAKGDFVFTDPDGATYELPNSFSRYFDNITENDTEQIEAVRVFARRLSNNPKKHARLAIADWVAKNPSISILADGRIIGYRGLRPDFGAIHEGFGVVNGVPQAHDGHLDNSPGNVLEFPTELVDHNPNNVCSFGLHFGTWDYAYRYSSSQPGGGQRVAVAIAPEDVVSAPNDASQGKLRTLKFEVIESVSGPYAETVIL
jgi:hypothetical protein